MYIISQSPPSYFRIDTLSPSAPTLAVSYYTLSRDQEAMQLYQQTLELRKRALGDEHPDTLQSMHNLALSYSRLDHYLEALQLGKQSVKAQRRILGRSHPNIILFTKMLAKISRDEKANHKKEARPKSSRQLSRFSQFVKR